MDLNTRQKLEENKKVAKNVGIGFVVLVLILFLVVIIKNLTKGTESSSSSQTENQPTTETQDPTALIQQYDIKVTSQIVKKVGNKYRYFFLITNNSDKDFAGQIDIKGKTGSGIVVVSYSENFNNKPLLSGLGRSVYTDANTAPKHLFGENGTTTYTYTAKMNNQEVAKGDGLITDNYENTGL